MRILIAHSFYRLAGGEDRYVRQQVDLLSRHHAVHLLERANETLEERISTAARMIYSPAERRSVSRAIGRFQPDVVHLHNAYPSFGPAVHLVAQRRGLPLVMTVHNFRMRCPNGVMFTEGQPCRRCEGGNYANAVVHECFPTRSQAAAYAGALLTHRFALRLDEKVTLYVAPSRFMRDRLVQWGVPAERVEVVRNFTDLRPGSAEPGSYGLYVGRLSDEKGLDDLLHALVLAGDPPFHLVGEGPAANTLVDLARRLELANLRFQGRLDRDGVEREMRGARYVAFSSRWDENAPLAALEAMAAGRPLLVTRTGGLTELVEADSGITVDVGDVEAMGRAIRTLMDDDARCRSFGERALARALAEFTPEPHRLRLEEVYERAQVLAPLPPRHLPVIESAGPTTEAAAVRPGGDRSVPGPEAVRRSVLMAHCYYRDLGGENLSFEAEARLLQAHGQRVVTYTRDNREIDRLGIVGRAGLAARTVWADDSYRALLRMIDEERPDVVHFQNTFPLISPAAYYAARRSGVAVVQALRNYRPLCANGLFFRDGGVCEDCLGRSVPWPGLVHACYRDSALASGVVVAMEAIHHAAGTWRDQIDLYLAPSEFSRTKFIEAGFPADRIAIKPNFVDPDPGPNEGPGDYALFAGRLAPEKGVLTLVEAWRRVRDLPLRIAGDGPLGDELERFVERHGLAGRVELLGQQPPAAIIDLMKRARVVIFPSEWYETFGRVAAEAFACGVPVVAAKIGAVAEIVADGRTGLHFRPGDAADLAAKVEWLERHPVERRAFGVQARAEFERHYTASHN
ncbi:MAG TPA: glycosyltransferase, partial [Candidatus Saccharimonadales bacterium]|nr:glycosyltransferase [Candidatus Saccharimonadales bacterium]